MDCEPWGAMVRDISTGGIGLLCREQPPTGCTLRMKLHSRYNNLSRAIDATVMSVKQQNPGEFLVGCQFERELDADERRRLL
jgi:PilZ domain